MIGSPALSVPSRQGKEEMALLDWVLMVSIALHVGVIMRARRERCRGFLGDRATGSRRETGPQVA
jgi:hypothetical protein